MSLPFTGFYNLKRLQTGRLAQWQSVSFTPRRSKVQSLERPVCNRNKRIPGRALRLYRRELKANYFAFNGFCRVRSTETVKQNPGNCRGGDFRFEPCTVHKKSNGTSKQRLDSFNVLLTSPSACLRGAGFNKSILPIALFRIFVIP